jgi:hypothetical protein
MKLAKLFVGIALAATVYAGNERAVELKVLRRTPLMLLADGSRPIASLSRGQTVTVIELGAKRHCVTARTPTGDAKGWVDADAVQTPPAELVEELRQRRERASANRELIARHDLAAGMTREEVRASTGKPDKRARVHLPDGGAVEQWSYVTYRYVPTYAVDTDATGKTRRVVSYQRQPAGRKIITFRGDEVVAVVDEMK